MVKSKLKTRVNTFSSYLALLLIPSFLATQIQYLETRLDSRGSFLIVHLSEDYPIESVHLDKDLDDARQWELVLPGVQFTPERVQLTRLPCLNSWNIRTIETPAPSTTIFLKLHEGCTASLIRNKGLVSVRFTQSQERPVDYPLGPGDELEITLKARPSFRLNPVVDKDGTITLPLVGTVQVEGKTVRELTETLNQKFSVFYPDPGVSVRVTRFASLLVTVEGAVRFPGTIRIQPNMRLSEVIRKAGGFSEKAAREVKVIRSSSAGEGEQVEVIQMEQFPFFIVQPGDHIIVPELQYIYITGEIKYPGTYRWREGLTLQKALELAGGLKEGASSLIYIIRTSESGTQTLTLSLTGEENDPALQTPLDPNDVIRIPRGKPDEALEDKPPSG